MSGVERRNKVVKPTGHPRGAPAERGAAAAWERGWGPVAHSERTRDRVSKLAGTLERRGQVRSHAEVYAVLAAADRVACAAMSLVAHATYASRVRLDGAPLAAEDFKPRPEGHTGGSLNMVPAYVGYLAANRLTGTTRAWLMGQGHCVVAVDAVNALVGNTTAEHAARYDVSDEGLTRFVQDFYSYRLLPGGRPQSPLGSHVNAYTAGGIVEGGYLGIAELLYPHMPLPGESLVAFLSDGAFEEQRGSDWVPRWWRAEDCGVVLPVMIANGRRIDQRTTMAQQGGVGWLRRHLHLNGFDPIDVDGRDPADYAWALVTMEDRLRRRADDVRRGRGRYPVRLPYAVAEVPKGFGFPGAGTNASHNLPLSANPAVDPSAQAAFRDGASRLHVPLADLRSAVETLREGAGKERPLERDHPVAHRDPPTPRLPESPRCSVGSERSPMDAVDEAVVGIVRANPELRVRVGNPDEMRSNRLGRTLDLLRHRVTEPEDGVSEDVCGGVVTALNEEAVVCAALGNKAGLALVATYEAFGVKMLGALRQEVIFARQLAEAGRPPRWLSVPVFLTSHTWENGKNEQSHQDPTLAEALLGEASDTARVAFAADANSAVALLERVWTSRGTIWGLVVPKGNLPVHLDREQARQLASAGAIVMRDDAVPRVLLAASGAYQLGEVLRASDRLRARGVTHRVVYVQEPARFREPRDEIEEAFVLPAAERETLFPAAVGARVFVVHTRPEPYLGVIRPVDTGARGTRCLGYINRGGTLDVFGMLFRNRSTWAHVLRAVAAAVDVDVRDLLEPQEHDALDGRTEPAVLAVASR